MDSIPFPQVDLLDVTTSPLNKVRWGGHSSAGSDDNNEDNDDDNNDDDGGGGEDDDKFEDNVIMNISCSASLSTNTTSSSVYGSMLHR